MTRGALQWMALAGPLVGVVSLLVTIGFCVPANNAELKTTAVAERAKIRGELEGKVSALQAVHATDITRIDGVHQKIFGQLDEQSKATKEVSDRIYQTQIQILQELRGIGAAPSGPTFHRGRRDQ